MPDILEDCPITLSGMSYSDDYEGSLDARRTIVYQLDFEMEANFYSGVINTQIIRKDRNRTIFNGYRKRT